ncbi:putative Cystatin domain-containing protein [Helianthus annuus]|nr:putative Cystatin domain-containing protein [Helianthus annuus]
MSRFKNAEEETDAIFFFFFFFFAEVAFSTKQLNAALEFVKVIEKKEQVVQGIMYYIKLEANDGGEKKTYEAKVWVKPWENFKELQELKLV